MDTNRIEKYVVEHAAAGGRKLYFRINGDIPLTGSKGELLFFELLVGGKRVLVLHPEHLTPVATICYLYGVQMVQV